MQRRITLLASVLSLLTLLLLGSSGAGCGNAPKEKGSIIVGLTSEFRVPTSLHELHIVMRVNGEVVKEETRGFAEGMQPLSFPSELLFLEREDGDHVEVSLEGFTGGAFRFPLVRRLASTVVVGGHKLLMRVPLETECAVKADGSTSCDAPDTCVTGACRDSYVSPEMLSPYEASWSQPPGDICNPAGGGDPIVIVGKGQFDYLPMKDNDVAQVEAGPQGGYHIWVAVRMKNLDRSGSITMVSGYVPDLDLELSPMKVIFTFNQDEGGFCKLPGLRYQLDSNGVGISELLGRKVKLTVKVTETTGDDVDVGIGERIVTLSETSL